MRMNKYSIILRGAPMPTSSLDFGDLVRLLTQTTNKIKMRFCVLCEMGEQKEILKFIVTLQFLYEEDNDVG